jgi:hypothetical protein
MCYILCMTRTSVYIAPGAQGGKRGGQGGWIPLLGGFAGGRDPPCTGVRGQLPKILIFYCFCVHFWTVFQHMVFRRWFSISS